MEQESKYTNYSVCASCGGRCCKGLAGSYIPSDFDGHEITTEFIAGLLKTEKVGIDWIDGDPDIYYLRPRHVGEDVFKGSWGGVCVNFTEGKGCSLPFKERPYQCRVLIPNPTGGNCTYKDEDKADKIQCADHWRPYQTNILAALEIYNNQ